VSSRRSTRSSRQVIAKPVAQDRSWVFAGVLALATLAAYQPAWQGGLLWDDQAHLTPPILTSWNGLRLIWTDFTMTQQYYPIVNSAFWVMNRIWGHDTLGYHLVNILLHTGSAVLVWRLLRRWSVPGAMVAAAAFALHPVHVESVAWMSELKNTMSGVFYLLAVTAYVRFDDTRSRRAYALAMVAFILALGSKTVTATLPAGLLAVLWWRRGRIEWRRDVLPLLPFFGAGVAAGAVTAWLEYSWVGAKGSSFGLTLVERVLLAGRAAWFYAVKVVWPAGLMFNYPRWSISQAVGWQYLYPLALVVVLGGLWAIRGRTRAPLAAAVFFLCTLFPALGFVNVYPFRYSFVADHFQYLASLGLISALAAGLTLAVRKWRPGVPEATLAIAVAAPLFMLTFLESRHYADSDTLYRTTIARNPSSLLARTNLSGDLLDRGPESLAEAEQLAESAVRLGPEDAAAHNNLGLAWQKMGRTEDALREHQKPCNWIRSWLPGTRISASSSPRSDGWTMPRRPTPRRSGSSRISRRSCTTIRLCWSDFVAWMRRSRGCGRRRSWRRTRRTSSRIWPTPCRPTATSLGRSRSMSRRSASSRTRARRITTSPWLWCAPAAAKKRWEPSRKRRASCRSLDWCSSAWPRC
jgi:hypothetical protein